MTYTVSLELPDLDAEDPRDAVRHFINDVQRQPSLYVYKITDDDTGDRSYVDLSDET